MASPQSAKSPWVEREIKWWLEHHSPRQLLIVVTSGTLEWNQEAGDFDWDTSTAVPPALRGIFENEPLWVDATWSRSPGPLAKNDPRLEDAVVDIASAIQGVSKDRLLERADREHKRTMRLARSAQTGLAVLLVLALAGGLVAWIQRNNAVHEANIALAKQLAATSESEQPTNLGVALLLAVQGYRTDPNAQTLAALMQADTSSPRLVRFTPLGSNVTQLAGSGDGTTIVAGLADGRVLRWTLADPHPQTICTLDDAITSLALSRDGRFVAAADGSSAKLWRKDGGLTWLRVPAGEKANVVALSPSGRTAIVHGAPEVYDGAASIVIFDTARTVVRAIHDDPWTGLTSTGTIVAPSDSETVLLENGFGGWERRQTADWSLRGASSAQLGAHQWSGIPADNGGYFTATNGDSTIPVWRTEGTTDPANPGLTAQAPISLPTALALSPGGTELAVADSGVIYVTPVTRVGAPPPPVERLTGNGSINATGLRFFGDDTHLLSASGDEVALWNLSQVDRLARTVPVPVQSGCSGCSGPNVAISPDGTRAAIADGNGNVSVIQPLPGVAASRQLAPAGTLSGLPVWDGSQVIVPLNRSPGNAASSVPAVFRAWPAGDSTDPVLAAGLASDRRTVIVVDDRGRIYFQDAQTGTVRKEIPGPPDLAFGYVLEAAAVHSSPDLVATRDYKGQVTVIDPDHGRIIGRIPGNDVSSMTFSGDRLLVQRTSGDIEVWNDLGSVRQRVLPGDASYTWPPVGNQQGTLVARERSDGSIEIDDLAAGTILDTFPSPGGLGAAKTGIAFAPDGTHLVTVTEIPSSLNSAKLVDHDISGPALVHAACLAASRNLSPSEWRTFVGTRPPSDLTCR